MTETELSHLQTNLQNLLDKQNYSELFKQLAKYDFFKGYEFSQLQNALIGGHIDQFFHQRVVIFVHKCMGEEREKLNVQLDEAILKKEQENARLDKEISEKKKILEALNQQIAQAKTELASSPTVSPDKEAEAQMWFERAEALPNDSDKILAYDKAIACKPDFAEAYFKRGKAKNGLKKYQEAITDFTKAIEYKPDFAEAYYERGETKRYYLSQPQESLADFTQAILLDPKHTRAYFNRGSAKKRLKMYQEAIADYKQDASLNPTQGVGLNGVAKCYSMLQDKPNTLKYLAEAIKLRPDCKQESKENTDFQWLWEDEDFKRLVA